MKVSIDGAPPVDYTGPFSITGDGFHTVTATGAGGADSTSFQIDTLGPAVSVLTPADGSTFARGSVVPAVVACTDRGGIQSCTYPSTVDTSTLGPHTFTATAVDNLGRTIVVTTHYTVIPNLTGYVAFARNGRIFANSPMERACARSPVSPVSIQPRAPTNSRRSLRTA